jgi:hypothetical protein
MNGKKTAVRPRHDVSKVAELYQKLNNESEVARKLGVSKTFIHNFRMRHQNEINYSAKEARKRTHDNRFGLRNKEIIELSKKGQALDYISKKFKLTIARVRSIIKKSK